MEPSELYGFDGLVSIYHHRRLGGADAPAFERHIGVGRVSNVQENLLIQVTVLRFDPGQDALWDRVRQQDAAALSDIRVKPTVGYRDAGLGAIVDE